LWQYNESAAVPDLFGEENNMLEESSSEANQENWSILTTLRGHLQDVVGLSWSPCAKFIISCSTDSTAIVFDVKKGTKIKMLDDHKGWVNGVAWDPLGKFVTTISSDRYSSRSSGSSCCAENKKFFFVFLGL
jgi:chromatin assembly factor 1 subunit B